MTVQLFVKRCWRARRQHPAFGVAVGQLLVEDERFWVEAINGEHLMVVRLLGGDRPMLLTAARLAQLFSEVGAQDCAVGKKVGARS